MVETCDMYDARSDEGTPNSPAEALCCIVGCESDASMREWRDDAAAQNKRIDHSAPAHLRCSGRIAGGCPHGWVRLLPRPRPHVDVPVCEISAFPAEWPILLRQRFLDEVDRFPETGHVSDRVCVV